MLCGTDEFIDLSHRLDVPQDKKLKGLIAAGFYLAATQKWTSESDIADVRSWVAELRSEMESSLGEISQPSCEKIIYAALTGDTEKMAAIDPTEVVNLEARMVFKLVYDRRMSESERVDFVSETEKLAREWGHY